MTGQSPRRVHVIRDGLAAHLPDIDPEETAEWLDSFDAVLDAAGQQRARYLMLRMLQRARERHVGVPSLDRLALTTIAMAFHRTRLLMRRSISWLPGSGVCSSARIVFT